jgi:hypothetical protein
VFHRDDLPIGHAEQPSQGDGEGRPPKTPSTRYMELVPRIPKAGKNAWPSDGGLTPYRAPSSGDLGRSPGGWALAALGIAVLVLFQGVVSGATTVTLHVPAKYSVTQVGAPPTPPATLTALADRIATPALAGLPSAGAQRGGTGGLAGTTLALPSCLTAACRDRYIVASPVGLVAGDYAERATFSLSQPIAPAGLSKGFLVEIAIHLSTGWIVGRAYLATGTTPRGGGATITLQLYVNLGTAAPPTILGVEAIVDVCSSTAVCP